MSKRRITCFDCRQQTSNPYSSSRNGREISLCYKCRKKETDMLIAQERLDEWNRECQREWKGLSV